MYLFSEANERLLKFLPEAAYLRGQFNVRLPVKQEIVQ